MDADHAFVGEHAPVVKLESQIPHGIVQAGLTLRKGRSYTGRIILAGDAEAKVEISLIWDSDPGDRQTISVGPISNEYTKFPLKFTSKADTDDGRLEIVGTGTGSLCIGVVSLMPADNIDGFRADMIALLKELKPGVRIVAVEPAESPVLTQTRAGLPIRPGKHRIQGIGAGFVPEVLNIEVIDEVVTVRDEDAMATSREMARREGFMCGISCGAAGWAALQLARREDNRGQLIVVILPDLGERYLSTPLFGE